MRRALLKFSTVKRPLFSSFCNLSLQVWYPLLRFREEGMETFTIGPEAGKTYTSKKGYPCKSDRDIASVSTQVSIGDVNTM